MSSTHTVTVPLAWEEAVQRTREALAAEPDLGALMPCNVVVRRGKDATETTIQAIDPQTLYRLSGSPAVRDVANEADTNLREALASLEGAGSSIS
jgi:uncharacterized protein (DUF302 family)